MKSITQKDPYGCGIACLAFYLNISYTEGYTLIPNAKKKAKRTGFSVQELTTALRNQTKTPHSSNYIKQKLKRKIYKMNTIIFIRRTKKYPAGHYLIRTKNKSWMDPWYNFPSLLKHAKSGFRRRLPGNPIYIIQQN